MRVLCHPLRFPPAHSLKPIAPFSGNESFASRSSPDLPRRKAPIAAQPVSRGVWVFSFVGKCGNERLTFSRCRDGGCRFERMSGWESQGMAKNTHRDTGQAGDALPLAAKHNQEPSTPVPGGKVEALAADMAAMFAEGDGVGARHFHGRGASPSVVALTVHQSLPVGVITSNANASPAACAVPSMARHGLCTNFFAS